MNPTIKLLVNLILGWFALYGLFHLPNNPFTETYTVFNLTTGVWFIVVGISTLLACYDLYRGKQND